MNRLLRFFYVAWRELLRLIQPDTLGVRLLLVKEDAILLVKHTYQYRWYLPGGGVQKGESFREAARREAAEELGASLGAMRLFGLYSDFNEFGHNHIVVFYSDDFSLTGETNMEIERLSFFREDTLPVSLEAGSQSRIEEYLLWEGESSFGPW